MRLSGWFCLVLGVASLLVAVVLGIQAIQHATEISAYHHARPCTAGAAASANCLRTVDGSVAGVTEFPGGDRVSADYSLDVRTGSTTLHLAFGSDSPMLGYAVNGDLAIVTMWRGVPVSVATAGFSDVTTSVPETALAADLGNSEVAAGVGAFFVLGALAIRQNRRRGGSSALNRPAVAATLLAVVLGSIVVGAGGIALGGKPSRLGPDLLATGIALVVAFGLSAWLGVAARRRALRSPASSARAPGLPAGALPELQAPEPPAARQSRLARTPLRARIRPAARARVLGAIAASYLAVGLTVAVLFGLFFTSQDGPPARAYRHAPACVGQTNLATCAGDFTAVINGVRGPANGANFAHVSYVTSDGVINAWAQFDGDAATIVRLASADETARTLLTIRVWRGFIVGAEFGGGWHWADGDPPANTAPAVFLAASFGLLLLVVRLRIHRRAGSGASRRLVLDDVGQVAAAAGSVVLLGYGFWPGAILALVVLLWLGLSARQSTRRSRMRLAALHAP